MRARAIACALWYGILPWWMYEDRCHYPGMTYLQHLRLNLRYAWTWISGRETTDDVAFELSTNSTREGR